MSTPSRAPVPASGLAPRSRWPGSERGGRRRRRAGLVALSLAAICSTGSKAAGQQGEATGHPLIRPTKDVIVIAAQARAALPPLQQGVAMMTPAQDVEGLKASLENVRAAYRYLRIAQENTELLIKVSRYPDPMLVFQKEQMRAVRAHLLRCRNNVLLGDARVLAICAENLAQALRKLQVLLPTLP
jgi:hypothetical protein